MLSNADALRVNQKLAQLNAALENSKATEEIINNIFSKSVDINSKVNDTTYCLEMIGETAVHFAFENNDIEALKILLNHGADVLATDKNNSTIAHKALDYYLDRVDPQTLEKPDERRKSFADIVISMQMMHGNVTNYTNNEGISHFHVACITNNVRAVEFFLDNGVSINHTTNKNCYCFSGFSPLHFASGYCNFEVAEVLLNRGADVHIKDSNGRTPLHLVLQNSFGIDDEEPMTASWLAVWDKMKHLLIKHIFSSGTNILDESLGLSCFYTACTISNFSVAKQYLAKFTDVNQTISMESGLWPGSIALHFAVCFSLDVVKFLVKKGADLEKKDFEGKTPLDMCMEKFGEEDICAILSMKKEWRNILLSDKKTKLLDVISAMKDCNQFSKFFRRIPKKADITIPYSSPLWPGYTLMHLAVLFCKTENTVGVNKNAQIIKELFDRNNNLISAQDAHGQTPLHICFLHKKVYELGDTLAAMYQQNDNFHDIVDKGGLSLLHIACALDDESLVKKLLTTSNNVELVYNGESIHDRIASSWTLLHIAVANNSKNVIKILLQHGADVYAKDANGHTPIHILMIHNRPVASSICRILLPKDLKNEVGYLHVASLCDHSDAAKMLLDAGADVNKPYTMKPDLKKLWETRGCYTCDRSTPLEIALRYEHSETLIDLLIKNGALKKENTPVVPNEIYYNLHDKTYNKHHSYFLSLLKRDEDFYKRIKMQTGLTKLHLACAINHREYIKLLLDTGARANAKMNLDSPFWPGFTPLHILIRFHGVDIKSIELLLSKGADVTMAISKQQTPVHKAYGLYSKNSFCDLSSEQKNKIFELISILLNAQTDFSLNPRNYEGLTHFHIACSIGDTFIVEQFLKHDVELNQPLDFFLPDRSPRLYSTGYTPLHLALTSRENLVDSASQLEIVDMLLKSGADVNAQDSCGNTPLHISKRFEVTERIIKGGADLTIINIHGQSALEMLLRRYSSMYYTMNLIRNGCYYNFYNICTGQGCIATILNSNGLSFNEMQLLMSTLVMNYPDAIKTDEMGRTAIHNVVSLVGGSVNLLASQYAVLIEQLSKAGIDVDDQDTSGRTALHVAVKFKNFAGIMGLLMMGADVNIEDANGQTSMAYSFEQCTRIEDSDVNCEHYEMFKILAMHVEQLLTCFLHVSEYNEMRVEKAFQVFKSEGVNMQFYKKLEDLKNVKIKGFSISMRDFVSELDVVSDYPTMSQKKRNAIDKFFRSSEIRSLRKNFGEVADLVLLQYRKAKMRGQLIEDAKSCLTSLIGFRLPDLCFHEIVRLLTNNELKNLIASA